jgi:hypothetical protein
MLLGTRLWKNVHSYCDLPFSVPCSTNRFTEEEISCSGATEDTFPSVLDMIDLLWSGTVKIQSIRDRLVAE